MTKKENCTQSRRTNENILYLDFLHTFLSHKSLGRCASYRHFWVKHCKRRRKNIHSPQHQKKKPITQKFSFYQITDNGHTGMSSSTCIDTLNTQWASTLLQKSNNVIGTGRMNVSQFDYVINLHFVVLQKGSWINVIGNRKSAIVRNGLNLRNQIRISRLFLEYIE